MLVEAGLAGRALGDALGAIVELAGTGGDGEREAPALAPVVPGKAVPEAPPAETPEKTCRATDAISGCANKVKAAETARAAAEFA